MREGSESSYPAAKSEHGGGGKSQQVAEKKENDPTQRDPGANDDGALGGSSPDKGATASGGERTGVWRSQDLGAGYYCKDGQTGECKADGLFDNESEIARYNESEKGGVKNCIENVQTGGIGALELVDSKATTTERDENERKSVNKRNRKVLARISDGKAPTTSRVLRSRTAVRSHVEKSDIQESGDDGIDDDRGRSITDRSMEKFVESEDKKVKARTRNGNALASSRVLQPSRVVEKRVGKNDDEKVKGDVIMNGKKEPRTKVAKMADPEDSLDIGHPCDDGGVRAKRRRGRPPKVKATDGSEDMTERVMQMSQFKRLRGRPLKVQETDSSENIRTLPETNQVKRKRGRPPKLHASGGGIPQKLHASRRGRPPKLHASHQCENHGGDGGSNLKGKLDIASKLQNTEGDVCMSRRKMKRKRGRPPKEKGSNQSRRLEEHKVQDSDGLMRKKSKLTATKSFEVQESDESMGKERKMSNYCPRPPNLSVRNQSNDKGSKRVAEVKHKRVETEDHSRQAAKRLLRERIVGLLLAAGWKVEYRPRLGRNYSDAVYVNPEGKTHWSVTLAYRVYKEQCKQGDDPETSNNDLGCKLLSEDELSILQRDSQKQRKDKGKKRLKQKSEETHGKSTSVKRKNRQVHYREKLHKVEKAHSRKLKLAASSRSNSSDHVRPQALARRHCTLLVRSSLESATAEHDGYVLYDGKRTLLNWMIDLGAVPLNGKVRLMNSRKTQVLFTGRITREGILCNCCNTVFTIPDFEIHSGSKFNQPFQNLYLENGHSLFHCLLNAWNSQDEPKLRGFHFVDISNGDPNDDTCGICGDGGDLICCDGCPSTFHQSCLDIEKFPAGDWFCVHCSCKFCGLVGEITNRRHDSDAAASPLLTCCSCEERYHQSCVQEVNASYDDHKRLPFCSMNCQKLFRRLQMRLGMKHELEGGFSCTLLHRYDIGSDVSKSDVSEKVECNCKLAVAFSVMDECFSPLVDHRSGANLLQNIVYNFGSNFNRLNYGGFLTAILERGDEVIAAASVRIHGNQLAEMPFIGTRYIYRHQGMCRRLMSGIESALCFLGVEKLVIPAVPELTETWTKNFGFKALEASSKQKIRNLNMLVFPRVDMLQKLLSRHNTAEYIIPSYGPNSLELEVCNTLDSEENNAHGGTSVGFDLDTDYQAIKPVQCDENDKTANTESHSKLPDGCSKDIPNITKENIDLLGSANDTNYHAESGVTDETEKGINTSVLSQQGPMFDASRPINEIGECHNAPVGSRTNTKSLENFVSDSPFDCLSVTAT